MHCEIGDQLAGGPPTRWLCLTQATPDGRTTYYCHEEPSADDRYVHKNVRR